MTAAHGYRYYRERGENGMNAGTPGDSRDSGGCIYFHRDIISDIGVARAGCSVFA